MEWKRITYHVISHTGASSTPGPNAPLGNLCGNSKQPQASAEAAYSQWKAAGFPANKMLLGLPLYGYVSQSTKTTLTDIAIPKPLLLATHCLGLQLAECRLRSHTRSRVRSLLKDSLTDGPLLHT